MAFLLLERNRNKSLIIEFHVVSTHSNQPFKREQIKLLDDEIILIFLKHPVHFLLYQFFFNTMYLKLSQI